MGYYLFNNLYKSYFHYNIDIIILYKKNPIVNLLNNNRFIQFFGQFIILYCLCWCYTLTYCFEEGGMML